MVENKGDVDDLTVRVALVSNLLGELLEGSANGRWPQVPPAAVERLGASARAFADAMALLQAGVERAERRHESGLRVVRS